MSQAVRDAIAQRRAALAQAQKAAAESPLPSPTKSGFESSKDSDIVQRSEDELLYRSVSTARLNISSRLPALEALPSSLFSLLDGEAPQWYLTHDPDETRRRPWYEREDLRVLSAANNDIDVIDERIGDFRGLARLELQNNRIPSLPLSTFQLVNLTTLNLSKNRLTFVPQALLALDSLIELDVSHNTIARLWTDAEVDEARKDRKAWDEENADEEGGIWSGLLERMGSPTKRVRPLPPSGQKQRSQPMRSLRVLNLAHNRLDDAALHDSGSWTWPPALVDLNVSDNRLRSTLPFSVFGRLKDLVRLSLGGSGFGDAVFAYDEARGDKPETPFGQQTFFPSLIALDLQRCEIDDLDKLKSVFETGEGVDVEPRTLLRVPSMAHAKKDDDDDDEGSRRTLSIVLEGNTLREENFKAKRGGASATRAATKSTDSVEATFSSMTLEPTKEPASSAAPTAAPSTPQSAAPAQTSPRKEAWELEAEAGLSTEGGRRRARAEAARREREAAAGGSTATPPASSSSTSTPTLRNGSRSRQADGVNKTGLSDWDGTPVASPRRANIARGEDRDQQRSGTRHDEQRNGGGGGAGRVASLGSTLANAKLTKRQSEALGRVPCKFFRSATGCSAGEACPFAHTNGSTQAAEARNGGSAGGEGDKGRAVCEFFIKGNCRFGHKCALAHVREGEPMSMDRHNKKMAAAAQRAAGGAATSAGAAAGPKSGAGAGSSQHQQQSSQHLFQLHQQPQQQPYTQINTSYQQQPPPPAPSAPPISYPAAAWPPRDDFAFGLPDDMNEGPHRPPPSQLPLPHSSGIGQSLHSSSRPLPYPQQQAAPINTASFTSSSPFAAGPPFGTSPFGSSPFGETVFYSNSYDDRRGSAVDEAAVASAAGGSFAARNARQQQQQRGVGWADGGESRHYYDEEAVDDADHDGEDFLPSSLNDLLTPAELERRRRRSAAAGEMPAMAPLTQSMPAGYGVDDDLGKGIWDVGGNARQRPAAGMSVGGGLGAAGYDEDDDILDIEVPNGLGVTPPPARRHHLQHHLLHHSPGQSLPKGLAAAGLSRLRISSSGSGASQPVAAAPSQAHHGFTPSSLSLGQAQAASSPHRRALNNAQAITSSSPLAFTSYAAATSISKAAAPSPSDLGPTAPSSLHPHLPGGVLAARGSNSSLSSAKLGTSASNNSKASAAAPGTSPLEGMAFGSILLSPPTGTDGATTMSTMMMAGGGGKGPAAVRSARRPSRGNAHGHGHVGGVAAAASPVALMPRRGEEVGGGGGEEEGVFELE